MFSLRLSFSFSATRQCSFGSVFVASNSNSINHSLTYTWTQANQICSANGGRLLSAPAFSNGISPLVFKTTYENTAYWNCVDDFWRTVSNFIQRSTLAWTSSCNTDNSKCSQIEVDISDRSRDHITAPQDIVSNNNTYAAVCQKGKCVLNPSRIITSYY